MMHEALTCITSELNEYFRNKFHENEDRVIISGIVNQDGSVAILHENKIVLTLINIEDEPFSKNYPLDKMSSGASANLIKNLHILFSAYFTKYDMALHFLDDTISFLQEKSVFTLANTSSPESRINKISVDMMNLSIENLKNLWVTLGAKYMPSVSFKIRIQYNY